jgi:hypothetical protein
VPNTATMQLKRAGIAMRNGFRHKGEMIGRRAALREIAAGRKRADAVYDGPGEGESSL